MATQINKFEIIAKNFKCVNSGWTANWKRFLNETCQCGFKCKIKVSIERNGHPASVYVLDEKEYHELLQEKLEVKIPLETEEDERLRQLGY